MADPFSHKQKIVYLFAQLVCVFLWNSIAPGPFEGLLGSRIPHGSHQNCETPILSLLICFFLQVVFSLATLTFEDAVPMLDRSPPITTVHGMADLHKPILL